MGATGLTVDKDGLGLQDARIFENPAPRIVEAISARISSFILLSNLQALVVQVCYGSGLCNHMKRLWYSWLDIAGNFY